MKLPRIPLRTLIGRRRASGGSIQPRDPVDSDSVPVKLSDGGRLIRYEGEWYLERDAGGDK